MGRTGTPQYALSTNVTLGRQRRKQERELDEIGPEDLLRRLFLSVDHLSWAFPAGDAQN